MASNMRGNRSRTKDGTLREKRGDTRVGTIEEKYGVDFGVRSDMRLDTYLQRSEFSSMSQALRAIRRKNIREDR